MENLTYRTDDLARWGTGQGSNMNAGQVDRNFFALFSAVSALEDHQQFVATIVSMHAEGNLLFVTLSDDTVVGPITIPTANWNFRESGWLPETLYAAYDVFNRNGSVYLVNIEHTTGAEFNPDLTDPETFQNVYSLLVAPSENFIPENGTPGQVLTKDTGSPLAFSWQNQYVRMNFTCVGQPSAGTLLGHFPVTDFMQLPQGLTGSVAYQEIPAEAPVSWKLFKNAVQIGTIDFTISPVGSTASFFDDVGFVPGDVFTIYGPDSPDAIQANVSFTFLAAITG